MAETVIFGKSVVPTPKAAVFVNEFVLSDGWRRYS